MSTQGFRIVRRKRMDPVRLVVLGYATYILVGWLVLCLPYCNKPSSATWLDHLFTATSAVSTTGLTTISTSDSYSGWGQGVVAALIQFGGLGYMTIGSFIILTIGGRFSMQRENVSEASMSLPQGLVFRSFLKSMIVFTFALEAAGALALYPIFNGSGVDGAAWCAVFHSISAFCTAGFGLFNDSFMAYRGNPGLNTVIIILSYTGAVGFIVLNDWWLRLTGRKLRLSLSSRAILWCTVTVSILGTALIAMDEPLLGGLPAPERWLSAWFLTMTSSTTVGFNTVDTAALTGGTVFLVIIFMIIGASPSGTGGGIKTTTVVALWAAMVSVFRGRERTTFGDRELPPERVRLAVASTVFYVSLLAIGIYALTLVDKSPLPDQMFECASAIGTVGLSRGITSNLSIAGKIIVILLMFAGRVGPLALGLTLLRPAGRQPAYHHPREDIAI